MSQSSMPTRTSQSLVTICVLCLCLSTGCAYSKNLLGKSKLADAAHPAQLGANPETPKADCAVPQSAGRSDELTALPVAPPTAPQPTANVTPANNGVPPQSVMPQQPVAQQQQHVEQPAALSAMHQQAAASVQQPVQQQTSQQVAVSTTPAADVTAATQAQTPSAPSMPAAATPASEQSQLTATISPGLPPATIQPGLAGSKQVIGPELSAAPASTLRAQAQAGSAFTCPPGMVPQYGYTTGTVSPPEKLAECEKQVFEMNQRLSELQFDAMKARITVEQMAEQQKQLLLDNERLRRRAELADQRYLEELDTLSEIVGEVVSRTGSANKSSPASRPSGGTNPLRPIPQSAAGQSL